MRNVPIPPREEDFTADPAELFFDLSFVLAFSRLVYHLVHHPTLVGVAEFGLLFGLIWIAWSNFTWSANAVAGNSRFVRVVFMIATAISLPMAIALHDPFGSGAPAFALAISVILTLPIVISLVLVDDEAVKSSGARYLTITVLGMLLVLAGGFVGGSAQVWMWIGAFAVLILGTIDAGGREWLVRPGHFAERHGLIVIIALGEVIVAIGVPVIQGLTESGAYGGTLLAALTAAGLLAGLLWWSYFDRPLPALERRHDELTDTRASARYARDVYTYNHFFIVAAILLAAAALEEIMLHPSDPLPAPFRWMLFIGVSSYLMGVVVSIIRAYRSLAVERLLAVGVLGALIWFGGSFAGLWLLIAVDVLLLVLLIIEHYRVEIARKFVPVGSKN